MSDLKESVKQTWLAGQLKKWDEGWDICKDFDGDRDDWKKFCENYFDEFFTGLKVELREKE